MSDNEVCTVVCINEITFHVISRFYGTVELEYLIKRLIQQEIIEEHHLSQTYKQ